MPIKPAELQAANAHLEKPEAARETAAKEELRLLELLDHDHFHTNDTWPHEEKFYSWPGVVVCADTDEGSKFVVELRKKIKDAEKKEKTLV